MSAMIDIRETARAWAASKDPRVASLHPVRPVPTDEELRRFYAWCRELAGDDPDVDLATEAIAEKLELPIDDGEWAWPEELARTLGWW